MGRGGRCGSGGTLGGTLVTLIFLCPEPSLSTLANMEQMVPSLASEQLPSISSFSALGRVTGPLGKCLMGWKVGTKQASKCRQ